MKRIISFLLILFILFSAVPLSGAVNAAGVTAKSVISRIYVNGAYQPTEAYMINSQYYYKIQDIAASVRDLSVRFTYVKNGNNLNITTGKNHILNGTEYSASYLLDYPATNGGEASVDGAAVNVSGYIINENYCLTMKEAAKLLSCGYKAVEKGKYTDYQLMTSYKYNTAGKLERKLKQQGNTAFNRMWEGFTASYKDNIYFLSSNSVYKMNNEGTQIKKLFGGYVTNINIINERIYYTIGGKLYSTDLDGNDNVLMTRITGVCI